MAYVSGINSNDLSSAFILNRPQSARALSQLQLNSRRHDLALFVEVASPMRDFLHGDGFIAHPRQHAGRADRKILTTRICHKYLVTNASFKNSWDIVGAAQLKSSHTLSDKVVDPIF
jgi:hypothetical protein